MNPLALPSRQPAAVPEADKSLILSQVLHAEAQHLAAWAKTQGRACRRPLHIYLRGPRVAEHSQPGTSDPLSNAMPRSQWVADSWLFGKEAVRHVLMPEHSLIRKPSKGAPLIEVYAPHPGACYLSSSRHVKSLGTQRRLELLHRAWGLTHPHGDTFLAVSAEVPEDQDGAMQHMAQVFRKDAEATGVCSAAWLGVDIIRPLKRAPLILLRAMPRTGNVPLAVAWASVADDPQMAEADVMQARCLHLDAEDAIRRGQGAEHRHVQPDGKVIVRDHAVLPAEDMDGDTPDPDETVAIEVPGGGY